MTGTGNNNALLAERVIKGDRRAAARVISMLEDNEPAAHDIIRSIYSSTGNAHVVGITGPPGAGKSTLVDKLTRAARAAELSVGVVAVDPTSPFTGGALLGDRVRMQDHFMDTEVFIRSMATRGWLGGLARATKDVVKVMDAMGKNIIFVETVGAGQSEVSIIQAAHTSIVVEMPGLGDDIQAIKAGILEIGDIFVVNKADRADSARTVAELRTMLDFNTAKENWRPPVLETVARDNKGIDELMEHIHKHREYLKDSGKLTAHHHEQARAEFRELLKEELSRYILDEYSAKAKLEDLYDKLDRRELDPYTAVQVILKEFSKR